MTTIEQKQQRSRSYWRGKSKCTCGHVGDGQQTEHAGINGHGACLAQGCMCGQFSWNGWTEEFERYLNEPESGEQKLCDMLNESIKGTGFSFKPGN